MGFFSLKVKCDICGEDAGLNRFRIANKGWICSKCFKRCGFTATTPIGAMTAESIKEQLGKVSEFTESKAIGAWIKFDDEHEKFMVCKGLTGKGVGGIYNYSDILDYELLEDGASVIKGGIGRAVVGGALLGGVGAIVGGSTGKRHSTNTCTSLKVKITLKDMQTPMVYVDFIKSEMKKDGFTYKTAYNMAQECLSVLQIICDRYNTPDVQMSSSLSNADEILKFKELKDSGIITDEEFEKKKQELLNS